MISPTNAARTMQRLSAASRWAQLSPETRTEVMRTVRRMGIEKQLSEQNEKPSAITRSGKPKKAKAA